MQKFENPPKNTTFHFQFQRLTLKEKKKTQKQLHHLVFLVIVSVA